MCINSTAKQLNSPTKEKSGDQQEQELPNIAVQVHQDSDGAGGQEEVGGAGAADAPAATTSWDLTDVEGLVGECSRVFREARDAVADDQILALLAKVLANLTRVRQRLIRVAASRLNFQELQELQEYNEMSSDPSIEYFGLEWNSVFAHCFTLGVEVRLLKCGLQQDRLHLARLTNSLAALNTLEIETRQHSVAVRAGRLRVDSLYLEQQRVTAVGQLAVEGGGSGRIKRSRSSQCVRGERGATSCSTSPAKSGSRQPLKYRGSKTDSRLQATSTAAAATRGGKRKSSVIENIANMFRLNLNVY